MVLRPGGDTGTRGDEVRRRVVSVGLVGVESEGVREWAVKVDADVLTDRNAPALLDRIRDLGCVGSDRDERGDVTGRGAGEGELLPSEKLGVGLLGETTFLFAGGDVACVERDEEVACCLRVGEVAVAFDFDFARLAAIAAATLLFFAVGVVGGSTGTASGSGQAFSSCLRAVASSDSRIGMALSRQTPWKAQKSPRPLSRTLGLGSASAFLRDFSIISTPPTDSMWVLERTP